MMQFYKNIIINIYELQKYPEDIPELVFRYLFLSDMPESIMTENEIEEMKSIKQRFDDVSLHLDWDCNE